jgi:hypothetical protein
MKGNNEMDIIPARGSVEFVVHPHERDDGSPDLEITPDWVTRWSRPVVGLAAKTATAGPTCGPTALPYEPVVTDEIGELYTVSDYLQMVVGSLHQDHCSHYYWVEIDGPITSAPEIHLSGVALLS